MPTRLIREGLLTSEAVSTLSWVQRVFFFGLLLTADDYGLFDARPVILRTKIFPLDLDTVSTRDVQGYLDKLEGLGLVKGYSVDGRKYGQIVKYGQQYKSAPKHPLPDWADEDEYRPKPKKKTARRSGALRTVTIRHLDEDVDVDEDVDERDGAGAHEPAPTVREVEAVMQALAIATLRGALLTECATRFLDSMEAADWRAPNGTPVRKWQAAARNWARRYAEREAKRTSPSTTKRKDCNANTSDDYD